MKIDLHVHSSEYSPCGRNTMHEMIRAAQKRGLDALVFTNHNTFVPANVLRELNRQYAPFRIFGGIELSIHDEHLVVIGAAEESLSSNELSYPQLHRWTRETGAWLSLAHPYRFHLTIDIDIETYPPDAIEAGSNNIEKEKEERIIALCERLHAKPVWASDAHWVDTVGSHAVEIDGAPEDERELAATLRAGLFAEAALS